MSTLQQRLAEPQGPTYWRPPASRSLFDSAATIPAPANEHLRYTPARWLADLIEVIATIDTVWILTREYVKQLYHELRDSGAADVQNRAVPGGWWWAYRITKPTARTYRVLSEWRLALGRRRLLVCRVDIATDFVFRSARPADFFKAEQGTYLRLRRAANNGFWFNDETRLFVDFRGKRHTRRAMSLYTNRTNDNIVRLELKLRTTHTVRANGLGSLMFNPAKVDPRALFSRHVMVRQFKPHWLQRKVTKALAHDNIRGGSWPLWRQNLPGRVVADYERWAHDDPNHKLPMKVVTSPLLMTLIPTRLFTPK